MAIIKSVRAMFHFILSEATDWRSRDEVSVHAVGDDDLQPGALLMAGTPATGPMVLHDGTAAAVTAVLCQGVAAGETARRTVLSRDAEVVGEDIVIAMGDGPATQAKVDALKPLLAPLGIIVRNSGTDAKV